MPQFDATRTAAARYVQDRVGARPAVWQWQQEAPLPNPLLSWGAGNGEWGGGEGVAVLPPTVTSG